MRKIIDNSWAIGAIVLGIVFALVLNNATLSFWDQDESSYAGFAFNMIKSGDFITPEFTWGEPHRKTPFHFWAIAASYQVFGINEFAVRFPSLIAVLFTAGLVFFLGRRIFGREVALTGALVMLCSILLPSLGKIAVTDAILLFFETLAILSLIRMLQHPNLKDSVFLFLGLSGGLLVKGPPVLMLVGVTGFVLLVLHPNRLRLFNLKLIVGVLLSFLPILIWGRLAWLKDDGVFITFLTEHYIVNRAKGGTFANQTGPPGYYFGIFILSFLFWLPFFISGLKESFLNVINYWRKRTDFKSAENDLILFCWCVGGWLLYEPIKSKLPAYALGAYPAIAILIAKYALGFVHDKRDVWFNVGLWIQGILTFIIAIAFCIAFYLLLGPTTLPYTIGFGLIFLATTGISFWKFAKDDIVAGFKYAFTNAIVFLILGWGIIVPLLEPNRSIAKRATIEIDKKLSKQGKVVFSKNFYLPSFPFYILQTGRTYIANDPTIEELLSIFSSKDKVAIVLDESKWEELKPILRTKLSQNNIIEVKGWALDMAKPTTFTIIFN